MPIVVVLCVNWRAFNGIYDSECLLKYDLTIFDLVYIDTVMLHITRIAIVWMTSFLYNPISEIGIVVTACNSNQICLADMNQNKLLAPQLLKHK